MKKYLAMLLVLMLLVFPVACGVDSAPTGDITTTPSENNAAQTQTTPSQSPTSTPTPASTPTPTTTPEPVPTEFHIGDTLSFQENYEIRMTSMEYATRVNPPNPDSYYSYYEVKDSSKVYIHSIFEVKNLKGNSLSADEILTVNVLYDEKYTYNSFSAIEEDGGSDFTYTNITSISPLTIGVLHFITEVPVEVRDSGKSVELSITAMNKTLTCLGETDTTSLLLLSQQKEIADSNTAWQKYIALSLGETVVADDYAEMNIIKVEFTDRVNPTSPGGYYSYYEVKDSAQTYVHIVIEFKNLKATGADADGMAGVEVIYDNKYTYRGFTAIEEDGGSDLTYTNITRIDPLDKGTIHYIVEVPLEVRDSGKPVAITISLNRTNYSYILVE